MIYGLTVDGFVKKPLSVIKIETEEKLTLAFGEQIDTIPQSVFGIIIGVLSEEKALEWETLEQSYLSFYPSTAQGNPLSELVLLNGLQRELNETDVELRVRREVSVGALGNNLVDSLFGQLLDLENVDDALVLDNKTDVTDANGIPPHQFACIVQGGDNAEIGDAIWLNTPQGINSFGSESEIVIDAQGNGQEVFFSRPDDIPIFIIINVTADIDFPFDGDAQIKTAVSLFGTATFKISDDVITSRFYTPINLIDGVLDAEILIDTSATPTTSINIPISITELSSYSETNIIVNVI